MSAAPSAVVLSREILLSVVASFAHITDASKLADWQRDLRAALEAPLHGLPIIAWYSFGPDPVNGREIGHVWGSEKAAQNHIKGVDDWSVTSLVRSDQIIGAGAQNASLYHPETYAFHTSDHLISQDDLLIRKLKIDGEPVDTDSYAIVVTVAPFLTVYALGVESTLYKAYARAKSLGHRPAAWHRIESGQLTATGNSFGIDSAPDTIFSKLSVGQEFRCCVADEIHRKLSDTQALALSGFEEGETIEYEPDSAVDFVTSR
ncbi:hypothetical protein RYA05_04290 [Pseudomonas syringae pv. actinidiae]|nr:hypothetical protein [Pseudomonas syringae pv. actinidiae]